MFNGKKSFLVIALLIILICGISSVSAADLGNQNATDLQSVVLGGTYADDFGVSGNNQVISSNYGGEDVVTDIADNNIYVSTSGDDSNDGSASSPVATIKKALTLVKSNKNTIIIADGTYKENNLLISSKVTIVGEHKDNVIIDGMNNGTIFYTNMNIENPVTYGTEITFKNLTLINGNNGSGGAICIFDSPNGQGVYESTIILSLYDCVFKDNVATVNGGAIRNGNNVNCYNCSFINNKATGDSGAIRAKGIVLNDCEFINNTASDGGAIYAAQSIKITNSEFVNNAASNDGGAIYGNDLIEISNSKFENNSASEGGAIYSAGSWGSYSLTLQKSALINNTAPIGAAIYVKNKAISVSECTFINSNGKVGNIIYVPNQVSGTSTISKSILVSDNGDDAIAAKSKVTADGNWWGTNTAPNLNSVTINNWVVLNATSNGTDGLKEGDVIAIDAGFTLNNGSALANAALFENYPVNIADEKLAIKEGKASANYTLVAGNNNIKVTSDKAVVELNCTAIQKTTHVSLNATEVIEGQNVTITATVPSSATGDITFTVNNKTYKVVIEDGKATVTIPDLHRGTYFVDAVYSGDANNGPGEANTTFRVIGNNDTIIVTESFVKYFRNATRWIAYLTDFKGNPIENGTLVFNINGEDYNAEIKEGGRASIAINLPAGHYVGTVSYAGDGKYAASSKTVDITVLSAIESNNLELMFQNGSRFVVKVLNGTGSPAAGAFVEFNINGVIYNRTTKADGSCSIAINLPANNYIVTTMFNGEMKSNNITVHSILVENSDLIKYYKNGSQYTVKALDKHGKAVVNTTVQFNINGEIYKRTTNDQGIAKMNINLGPGTYVITAMYGNCAVSNNVTVLSVVKSDNLVMSSSDRKPFIVTLLDDHGKPLVGANFTMNINGVFYPRTTNENGTAKLNINLMPAEYIITIMYNGLFQSNTVSIKP